MLEVVPVADVAGGNLDMAVVSKRSSFHDGVYTSFYLVI